jgi:hypothetical protein
MPYEFWHFEAIFGANQGVKIASGRLFLDPVPVPFDEADKFVGVPNDLGLVLEKRNLEDISDHLVL